MNLNPQSTRCDLCLSALRFGVWIVRVDKYENRGRFGYQFIRQLDLFSHKVNSEQADPCRVATGPIKAGDQTMLDWITAGRE
jgi:hypothetical protein